MAVGLWGWAHPSVSKKYNELSKLERRAPGCAVGVRLTSPREIAHDHPDGSRESAGAGDENPRRMPTGRTRHAAAQPRGSEGGAGLRAVANHGANTGRWTTAGFPARSREIGRCETVTFGVIQQRPRSHRTRTACFGARAGSSAGHKNNPHSTPNVNG